MANLFNALIAAAAFGLSCMPSFGADAPIKFRMSGGSMKPTIAPDAMLTIEKYQADALPGRGDIIAFRLSSDRTTLYFKRVVGMPAEKIQMVGGVLQINGRPVARDQLTDFKDKDLEGNPTISKHWRETLPNGTVYETLQNGGGIDDTPLVDVGPSLLFVLGDNRDDSSDSRVAQVGLIPLDNVVGRVARP